MFTAAIPLVDWIFAATIVFFQFRLTWRESFLVGATLATAWLVIGTESLSLCHALTFWPVLLWWLAPLPFLVAGVVFLRDRRRFIPPWPRLGIFDYSLLAAIVFILGWAWCQAFF